MSTDDAELNHRQRATLRAVAAGRAELTCSCEPDLFIDGLPVCDQPGTRRLASLGLIATARDGQPEERVPAVVTKAGEAALQPTRAVPATAA
ncbi:MAG TPA: hypothetical protein VJ870_13660 [Amycolatopsis sp.]|nr:hypothetical protein [Amycolatopsis sp.]